MTRTLLLVFHPDLASSATNSALVAAARAVDGVEPIDMYRRYPFGYANEGIDGAAEARRLLGADRIILQFPIHWYSAPPLLKAWQDVVLTRMYYRMYDSEGSRLEGTPILIAATAGTVPEGCGPSSPNFFSLQECLNPLRATAHRCGLLWAEPFLVFRAGRLNASQLNSVGERYADRLREWIKTGQSRTGDTTVRATSSC